MRIVPNAGLERNRPGVGSWVDKQKVPVEVIAESNLLRTIRVNDELVFRVPSDWSVTTRKQLQIAQPDFDDVVLDDRSFYRPKTQDLIGSVVFQRTAQSGIETDHRAFHVIVADKNESAANLAAAALNAENGKTLLKSSEVERITVNGTPVYRFQTCRNYSNLTEHYYVSGERATYRILIQPSDHRPDPTLNCIRDRMTLTKPK